MNSVLTLASILFLWKSIYPCCCEEVVSNSEPDGQRLGDGMYELMEVQLWMKWAEVLIFVSEWNGLVCLLSWVVALPGSFAMQLSLKASLAGVVWLGECGCVGVWPVPSVPKLPRPSQFPL